MCVTGATDSVKIDICRLKLLPDLVALSDCGEASETASSKLIRERLLTVIRECTRSIIGQGIMTSEPTLLQDISPALLAAEAEARVQALHIFVNCTIHRNVSFTYSSPLSSCGNSILSRIFISLSNISYELMVLLCPVFLVLTCPCSCWPQSILES